ncbi:MAG: dipeptide epimerase [Clostridia bacterium BRH_c25]|nr:MAG: dipeptide epimerase [Clostridia bacterium BRH_c25]KUO76941.1 MAG: dipeptide epimerase [Clostridia bacterium BRH_c25]
MKITDIKVEKLQLKLHKSFKVSLGVIEHYDTVIVKVITDEGVSGVGESSPIEFVTGESVDTVAFVIKAVAKQLIGMDPLDIETIHHVMDRYITNNSSAKAGIDIALFDIKGKVMNAPLYKVLGGFSKQVETDITLSIAEPKEMAKAAKEKAESGFKILKIKAGIDPEKDIEAIRLIREAVGSNIKIRMDANQGWAIADAVMVMKAVEKFGVQAVEQPRPYWDIDGIAQIRSKVNIKVMVDESVFSPVDAIKVVKKEAADIINIKLMKSGGIYKAEQINAIAQAAGLTCMVGCMLESRIGIAAGAHFVASKKNILDADLDGFMFCQECEGISGGFEIEGGTMTLSDKPGIGVNVNM